MGRISNRWKSKATKVLREVQEVCTRPGREADTFLHNGTEGCIKLVTPRDVRVEDLKDEGDTRKQKPTKRIKLLPLGKVGLEYSGTIRKQRGAQGSQVREDVTPTSTRRAAKIFNFNLILAKRPRSDKGKRGLRLQFICHYWSTT